MGTGVDRRVEAVPARRTDGAQAPRARAGENDPAVDLGRPVPDRVDVYVTATGPLCLSSGVRVGEPDPRRAVGAVAVISRGQGAVPEQVAAGVELREAT